MESTKGQEQAALPWEPRIPRLATILVLAGLAAWICIARLHTFDEPLERDVTTYAVIGHELMHGRSLYSDLWDHKPPAIFLTFAGAEWVGGYGPTGICLLNVGFALVTMLGVFYGAKALGQSVFAGLCAAGFWSILSGDLILQANQPNSEVFLNACMAWTFALLVRASDRPLGTGTALLVGALVAWGSLYKQVALVPAVLMLGARCWFPPPGQTRRSVVREAALAGVIVAMAWGAVLLWFAAAGRFAAFWDAVVVYNRYYSGNPLVNLLHGLLPRALFPRFFLDLWLLVGLGGLGFLLAISRTPARSWLLLFAFDLGIMAAVDLPGHFFYHYYQLCLPVLAIAAAWGVVLVGRLPGSFFRWLPWGLAVVAMGFLLDRELPFYRLSADEWSRQKYGDEFLFTKEMGRQIDSILQPEETFYQWGNESGLYFYSRRSPISGILCVDYLVRGPLVDRLQDRLLQQLSARPPDLFLIHTDYVRKSKDGSLMIAIPPRVFDWFSARYSNCPVEPVRNSFLMGIRRGSQLERRMSAEAEALRAAGPVNR